MAGVTIAITVATAPGLGAAPASLPDFSTETATYDAALVSEGDIRWAADTTVNADAKNYYDRAYIWYAFSETARGDTDQQSYMDDFVDPASSIISPREWAPDGLVEHYLRNSDADLLESLRLMAVYAVAFIDNGWTGPEDGEPDRWEGRIQERALLVTMAADSLGVTETFDWSVQATRVKDHLLITQNSDGSWTPPTSAYIATSPPTGHDGDGQVSTNFMSAMGMSALIRYAEYYNDDMANIQQAVDNGMEWMWTTQWRDGPGTDQSFNYWSAQTATSGPTKAGQEVLNMLFVDVFGWLYFKTEDAKWITRGDLVFMGALDNTAYDVGVKQFNQFFRNSWRYLYYRDGYDISALANTTEVHR